MSKQHFTFRAFFLACLTICIILLSVMTLPASAASDTDPGLPVVRGDWQVRFPDLFKAKPTKTLTVGGDTFGVRLFADGVLIAGVADQNCPAAKAGLQRGDLILKIDNKDMKTVSEVVGCIEESGGKALPFLLRRGDEELNISITPVKDANGMYRVGMRVRDNAAGIGTVTFIDPRTGAFGGLGHGICDTETGELLPLERGAVMETEISDVIRGAEGSPGELKGYLCSKKIGTLLHNCECGVYGIFSPIPGGETLDMAERHQVHNGDATLRCTLGDDKTHDYKVELCDVQKDNTGTKCFAVRVVDKELLARTGGIVQGMSGSPIIQDGKLVGAVTHVLIGDPTRGYGIFLENMLAAMPEALS